jgi:hypothetical protein
VSAIGGVSVAAAQTPAQLTIIPGTGPSADQWASSKIVHGQLAGQDGATEDQGWYSSSYVDALPADVIVHDATLGATQKRGVFVWLLLPSPTRAAVTGASIKVTAVANTTVTAIVTVDGKAVTITVPYETP